AKTQDITSAQLIDEIFNNIFKDGGWKSTSLNTHLFIGLLKKSAEYQLSHLRDLETKENPMLYDFYQLLLSRTIPAEYIQSLYIKMNEQPESTIYIAGHSFANIG